MKYFNESIKQSYLNQCKSTSAINSYKRIFKRSKQFEDQFNKDLADFNREEVTRFLASLTPSSIQASRSTGTMVGKYMRELHPRNNALPGNSKFFDQFVDDTKRYLSKTDIHLILNKLTNNQDKVIIQLLFEGFDGREHSEMRNIKISDIDVPKKTVTVKNEKNHVSREANVSEKLIDLMFKAHDEEEYIKSNGEMKYHERVKDVTLLTSKHETNYVLKTAQTHNTASSSEKTNHYTIDNRLKMMRKLDTFSDFKDRLTSKNIFRSGMLFTAYQLLTEQNVELNSSIIKQVCRIFGVKFSPSFTQWFNMETITSLYPIFKQDSIIEDCFVTKDGKTFTRHDSPEGRIPLEKKTNAKHIDFDKVNTTNKQIGNLGELAILEYEREILKNNGRPDLARKVEHTSVVKGDGAGYDIKSYMLDGDVKYIEVKTTTGDIDTAFYLTNNELSFSRELEGNYYLYRVFDFDRDNPDSIHFYTNSGDISSGRTLIPKTYMVY